MDTARRFATVEDLSALARAALGGRLIDIDRLRGGTKKGVYRLILDDGTSAIAYLWNAAENYWPTGPAAVHHQDSFADDLTDPLDDAPADSPADDLTDPFAPASGLDLFEAAHRCLAALGVRVPQLYLIDRSRKRYPAEIAVLEDVRGGGLEALLERDPVAAQPVLIRLAEMLEVMRAHTGSRFGKVALIDDGGVSRGVSCEQMVVDRALADLAEAAVRDARIGAVRDRLEDVVRHLFAQVRPRSQYGLIHGELGPDHVLVDARGEPVLIDIEGLMFFDIEWEHVFLDLRFHEHYRRLECSGLDPARLTFYMLAIRLSLVAGPLRLLDGDFPDRDGMLEIVEWNLQQVLTFLP